MKRIFINIALLVAALSYSQTVPQAFNYQGIARDGQGISLASKTLGIKITLQEKSGNTTTDVYAETHSVTTNAYGLFNLSIGKGKASIGTFSGVNFEGKNISVKTEIDPSGGSNYTINGSSELLSVPYALVAGNTSNNSSNYWEKNTTTNALFVNKNEKVGIGTSAPEWLLHLSQNASGADRNMVMINNTNNGTDASVGLTLKVGTASDDILAFGYNGPNYSVPPNVQSRGTILSKNIDLKAQSSTGSIKFYTGGQIGGTSGLERMSINADGNIGIGTPTPTATLDLIGTARLRSITSTTANTRLLTGDASGNLAFRDLSSISSLNGGPWAKNDANNSVTVTNGEKVGIGIAKPTQPLHLESNQTSVGRVMILARNTNPNNDCNSIIHVSAGGEDINNGGAGLSMTQHSRKYTLVPNYGGMASVMTDGTGLILNTRSPGAFISFMTENSGFEYEKMRLSADGKLGIGTQAPAATLDVVGTAKFGSLATSTTNTRLLSADASGNLAFRDLATLPSTSGPWTNVTSGVSYSPAGVTLGDASKQEIPLMIARESSGIDRTLSHMTNTSNANNSVGGSVVAAGTGNNHVTIMMAAFAKSYFPELINSGCGVLTSEKLSINSLPLSNSTEGYIKFVTGGNSTTDGNGGKERIRITYDGKVGIGTQTPSATLDVVGTAKFSSLAASTTNTKLLTADASGNLAFRDLSTLPNASPWTKNSTTNTVTVSNGEKVGIGTNTPSTPLHIKYNGTGETINRMGIALENTSNAEDHLSNISIVAGTNSTSGLAITHHGDSYAFNGNAGVSIVGNVGNGLALQSIGNGSKLSFKTGFADATEKMRLTQSGNLGIGTITPTAKLQVSQGDIYLDDATKGVIMTSPNGQCWRMTISNTGAFVSTPITCP